MEVGIQLIETALPQRALLGQPALRRLERPRREPVGPDAADLPGSDEPAFLEHPQVLGEGGQRHPKAARQLARGSGAAAQPLDDLRLLRNSCQRFDDS